MEQSTITEHDCNVLGGLFQIIINDLKNGTSTWEDFILKATKFHTHLKSTISASTAFLDSFQKIADMATTTRGGTKEIGTSLTRLCLRQRSVEAKLKSFSCAFMDCLIIPLQERVEEWKKTTIQLDKERTKELKRLRQEFKKRQYCDSLGASGSVRGKKHSSRLGKSKFDFFDSLNSKGIYGTIGSNHKSSSSLSRSMDSELDCNERLLMLEELEKKAVRRALIEERSHFCLFVKFLRPIIEEEISMIGEISHIQEIMDSLLKLTVDPFDLPVSSETVLSHLKLNKNDTLAWNLHTPPSSPSSLGSRKSSMCSISSYNSSSSNSNYGQTTNNNQNKYFSHSDMTTSVYGSLYREKDNDELQFQVESLSNNGGEKSTIKITSTNPFLSSYNQITHTSEECQYEKNPSSSTSISSNSTYLLPNHESDGSITPTNTEQFKSLIFTTETLKQNEEKTHKSAKPPPAPPVRRTSSLSNPHAITLGTIKNAINNKNYDLPLSKNSSLYDEINVLTKSMNDINFTLKNTDFTNSSFPKTDVETKSIQKPTAGSIQQDNQTDTIDNNGEYNEKSDYKIVKKRFENLNHNPTNPFNKSIEDDSSQLPLPAPPPEAFVDTVSTVPTNSCASQNVNHNHQSNHQHYNKITNVHREFLETLNSKLSQSPLVLQNNTRISRKSTSSTPDDYAGYTGKHRSSNSRSASTSRIGSRKNSIEKNNGFSVASSPMNENFLDKLSHTILQKQPHHHHHHSQVPDSAQIAEIAKAAASNALQRKQSVPDLNELNVNNLKNQNRATFSSSLNLTSSSAQGNQPFQVVEIQTNSTQQPIYASRSQLRQEINDLYGSFSSSVFGSDRSYHQNGFFNKL